MEYREHRKATEDAVTDIQRSALFFGIEVGIMRRSSPEMPLCWMSYHCYNSTGSTSSVYADFIPLANLLDRVDEAAKRVKEGAQFAPAMPMPTR